MYPDSIPAWFAVPVSLVATWFVVRPMFRRGFWHDPEQDAYLSRVDEELRNG